MLFADHPSQSPYRAGWSPDSATGFVVIAPSRALSLTSSHCHSGQFGCRLLHKLQLLRRRMFGIVTIIARHDGPGDARHLVGQCHRHQLERLPGQKRPCPVGQGALRLAALHAVQSGVRSHHQQAPQVAVAHLGDFAEPGLAAG